MGMELVGRKLGMTQLYREDGEQIPVTVLAVGPCVVVQKKTVKKDGYSALQLGYEERKEKHVTQPLRGHFTKAGVPLRRVLFEARISPEEAEAFAVGQSVELGPSFDGVQSVDVTGVTKGRGFAGVIKRWNFHRHKMSHGTHEYFRHGGANGSGTYPGKVWRGHRMPGRYGGEKVTQLGLHVERIDVDQNLLFVRGAVPGHRNALVRVRRSDHV
jgi:large subunit ribosomal protein L3